MGTFGRHAKRATKSLAKRVAGQDCRVGGVRCTNIWNVSQILFICKVQAARIQPTVSDAEASDESDSLSALSFLGAIPRYVTTITGMHQKVQSGILGLQNGFREDISLESEPASCRAYQVGRIDKNGLRADRPPHGCKETFACHPVASRTSLWITSLVLAVGASSHLDGIPKASPPEQKCFLLR